MLSTTSSFAKRLRHRLNASRDSGQSLIETALALPFLLLIALNAINFAYYFFVAINLAAAPRNAVEYSVQGFATPGQLTIPIAGPDCSATLSVSTLAYNDIIRVLPMSTGKGTPCDNIGWVQVCNSNASGGAGVDSNTSGAALATKCHTYGAGTLPAPALSADAPPDPEAPNFVLDRVYVVYTVKPLIGSNSLGVFQLFQVQFPTFRRQVSMREMN